MPPTPHTTLFTVGHSNHEWCEFLRLLTTHKIALVADVRSAPVSRLPHFRRDELSEALRDAGIEYRFLGRELGARRDEPECYVDNIAVYERIAQLPRFQEGITLVMEQASRKLTCLMCAEKAPLDCHRTILISRELGRHEVSIQHILADATLEDHAITERRLMRSMKLDASLLDSHDAVLAEAYERRGRQIAYHRGTIEKRSPSP